MEHATLIKRFVKFGYQPDGKIRLDLEIQRLIRWLFVKRDIHITTQYCSLRFPANGKIPSPHKRFWGKAIFRTKDDTANDITTEITYRDPNEALFEALKMISKSLTLKYGK